MNALLKSFLFGISAIFLITAASPTFAQISGKTGSVDVFVGYMSPGDLEDKGVSVDFNGDVTFGVRGGYQFTKNWGIELQVGYSPTDADIRIKQTGKATVKSNPDVDIFTYDLNALYFFNPDQRYPFYVTAGVGGVTVDPDSISGVSSSVFDDSSDTSITFNVGGGLKFFPKDNPLYLRADLRYRYIDDIYNDSGNGGEATVAVGWTFGKR